MNRLKCLLWLNGVLFAAIIIITLIAAPSNNLITNGSTYNRSPNGYGAWYAFMQQQGTTIQRWRKPFSDLDTKKSSITFLRVNSERTSLVIDSEESNWVKNGNTLVILGVERQVTAAAFSTLQNSPVGEVKIDTTRRQQQELGKEVRLGDRFGAVVWQENIGKGQAIFATTPYLAANAYQDYRSNFNYLAQLVNQNNQVYVDEYVHGYKDKDVATDAASDRNWIAYLAQTPLLPILLQVGVLLLVLVWAQNRRFGSPASIDSPVVDNSQAYIQALAGVLQKAECSEFVLDVVGKEEQLQLQAKLGLGKIPLEHQALIDNWVQQTNQERSQLQQLLSQHSQKRRLSDKQLLMWLEKWQNLRDR